MTDPQSSVFRDAPPSAWDETRLVDHPNLTLADLDPLVQYSREEYEAAEWDADRAGPKTIEQARENLAARISDPAAPDTDDEAGAYDDEEA